MKLKDFQQPDGWYKDAEGCAHESAYSLLQSGMLGFCCCGSPDDNLLFIKDGLEHIDRLRKVWDKAITWEQWRNEGNALLGGERGRYFFYYWADKEGLTEHGGSVPGWLDKKGAELLALLTEFAEAHAEPDAETGKPESR